MFWDEQQVCTSRENGGNYANATTSPEGQRLRRPAPDAVPARHVDVARQQQAAARGRLRLLLRAGAAEPRTEGRPDGEPHTENLARIIEQCAARACRPMATSKPDAPVADDGPLQRRPQQEHHHHAGATSMALRDRAARSHQVGLHRQPARRSAVRQPWRQRPALPRQQRRAEPAHAHASTTSRTTCGCATTACSCRNSGRPAVSRVQRVSATTTRRAGRRSSALESRFFAQPLSWPHARSSTAYNDLTPRMAVALRPVRGDGKTAREGHAGQHLESTVTASNYGLGNPTSRIARPTSRRTWTDANGNWIPDCDLSNQQEPGPPWRRGGRLLRRA